MFGKLYTSRATLYPTTLATMESGSRNGVTSLFFLVLHVEFYLDFFWFSLDFLCFGLLFFWIFYRIYIFCYGQAIYKERGNKSWMTTSSSGAEGG
jgi:hypothetical protein